MEDDRSPSPGQIQRCFPADSVRRTGHEHEWLHPFFLLEALDLRKGAIAGPFEIEGRLPKGSYEVTGFLDTDGNAIPGDLNPDPHDPVAIPTGGFEVHCEDEPVKVQLSILMPE